MPGAFGLEGCLGELLMAAQWIGYGGRFSSVCELFCIAGPDCFECNNSVLDSCPQTAMKLVCQ